MARMMSGDITTNGTASGSASIRTARDKLDADALLAAQKINELLFQTPVPLSALFPRASGFGFESRPEPGGRHKRELVLSGTAMDAEKNSPDGHKKDNADDVATGPSPKSETVALPGGGSAPAPLRKDVNEKKRKAQALEAELAAATKARAASARDELARRRGAFARTGEESDSDSDDEGADGDKKNSGIDPEDENLLRSVGGGGFDFAAAAAAALPGGASFEALGAKPSRRRGGKGDASGPSGGGSGPGTNKKEKESKRLRSGKYDANGRMIMVEPFKPGKKSKAFPRSGERNSTFR